MFFREAEILKMKTAAKRILALGATVIAVLGGAASVHAQGIERNVLTGGPTGTYIQFGQDLSEASARCGITLNVGESAGSLENFLGVRKRRHTQFGIVQSDVLEFLKTFAANDPEMARAIFGVRIAFPLYNEEVHILARKDIATLRDLAGKKVAIGVEDSGTFLTASLVLDLTQIAPSERLTINAEESMQRLLAGEIDAFFYVAGAPTKIFVNDAIDGSKFHLLPISDPTLQAAYVPAKIPAGSYPFQPEALDVVAVKAVLMTYEYSPLKNVYHRESCRAVSDMAHIITSQFQDLRANGHPKWNQVDLNDIPPGWNISECVNAGLAEDYDLSCSAAVSPATVAAEPDSIANEAYRARICAVIGC